MSSINERLLANLKELIVETDRITEEYEDIMLKLDQVTTTIQLVLNNK